MAKTSRRFFLKSTAVAGGGFLLGVQALTSCAPKAVKTVSGGTQPDSVPAHKFNAYVVVHADNRVTIMAPNPEIGQGVKTSMPMIVADELDVAWTQVTVDQAPFDKDKYKRQLAGGSQSIRLGWKDLRTAGATARTMLRQAAAQTWQVPLEEVTTTLGTVVHKPSNRTATYGQLVALAAALPVPTEVNLKKRSEFHIIGTPVRNVDNPAIVTGKPLFGMDIQREGMLIAMLVHPPAFGMQLKRFDATDAKKMPGIKDVFTIRAYQDGQAKGAFDNTSFNELVAVVGETTWQVMQAKKKVVTEWEPAPEIVTEMDMFGRKVKVRFPAGLESTAKHKAALQARAMQPCEVKRKDGDPYKAFAEAAFILERTYTAPFLPHNCMEPMNFFAHVQADKVELTGPIQTPEFLHKSVSARLGIAPEKIELNMTRMGGGFGRRLYGHYVVEAAVISQRMNAPVKLVYSREDDMSFGIYRPMYQAQYRAAFDAQKNLVGFHVRAGGVPESPLHANRFPAGAIDHYLAEEYTVDSNITVGAFRAPRSNFIAGAEGAFLDEIATYQGKDPIDFRLALLNRAKTSPVGDPKTNDYEPDRYAGVLNLVREKSAWDKPVKPGLSRGVSAYFCHNSYVAHVVDVEMRANQPVIESVFCAIDCGIVVNPLFSTNMAEGASVDGIGTAMFGGQTFEEGVPEHTNFHTYYQIRHHEAPKKIEVHFVKSDTDPTGMGEPPYPPVFGALANALHKATGKRFNHQPFMGGSEGEL